MSYEISCGAVVYTKIKDEIYWLIIRSLEGIYGFPKGHMENGENELDTAVREIMEETGISPDFVDGFRVVDEYPLPRKKGVIKRVVYFLAEFSGQDIKYQKEELLGAKLMTYDEAISLMQFDNTKEILTKARDFLNKKI